ncbi:hypothetical protein SLEP1_g37004 [Rubroshorea leprosula]|uniref:Uncharacterized protein n=1 Tax=Rubroshorea leprosula TaxID=152421 RepID=A0AAV5KTN2_9ROSI|nr:hypothetical protein SLEP1_g37004 [Rubroshorea leprosula]
MSAIEQKAALPAASGQLVGGAGALGVAITEKVDVGNRSQITDEALVSNLNLQAFYSSVIWVSVLLPPAGVKTPFTDERHVCIILNYRQVLRV